jgi:hypothetical protein
VSGDASLIEQIRQDFDRLRGRLFQAIEATGMPARQEDAVKGLVRVLSYDTQGRLEARLRSMAL